MAQFDSLRAAARRRVEHYKKRPDITGKVYEHKGKAGSSLNPSKKKPG